MIDPTPNERDAMGAAGRLGGEYLDSIGKTDLATLTGEQWDTFVEAIVTGYGDRLRELADRDGATLKTMTNAGAPF
ncbi:MAG: hypothetical protein RLZZ127_1323 [Planctomycetota bacterium]|jgi:hypothetical protein